MQRKKFLLIAGLGIVAAAGVTYILSDQENLERDDIEEDNDNTFPFQPGEKEILYLASLAPSGHNTQPWFVRYIEPYHWIIGNDQSKWLPAVDPNQRETILSIGAFIQNLEFAASKEGYSCQFDILAKTNQDENLVEVRLFKTANIIDYDVEKIKNRRTVRSGYLSDILQKQDLDYVLNNETDFANYIPNTLEENNWLNEQTIVANRIQTYRDPAQQELADWIRFSSSEAKKYRDGLTTAGMELNGIPGWILRNTYSQKNVLSKSFREQGLDKVANQVSRSAGWIIITSKDNSVAGLLETGKRFQRIFLKVRDKNIALHPMTQILEEPETKNQVQQSLGISDEIQFLIRTGYVKKYPMPVTLRRPINWFIKK